MAPLMLAPPHQMAALMLAPPQQMAPLMLAPLHQMAPPMLAPPHQMAPPAASLPPPAPLDSQACPPAALQVELVHLLGDVVVQHRAVAADELLQRGEQRGVGGGQDPHKRATLPIAGGATALRPHHRWAPPPQPPPLAAAAAAPTAGSPANSGEGLAWKDDVGGAEYSCSTLSSPFSMAGRSPMASRTVTGRSGAPTCKAGKARWWVGGWEGGRGVYGRCQRSGRKIQTPPATYLGHPACIHH